MANLTLLAGKFGPTGDPNPAFPMSTTQANPYANWSPPQMHSLLWAMVCLATAWPLVTFQQTRVSG